LKDMSQRRTKKLGKETIIEYKEGLKFKNGWYMRN